MEMIKYFGLAYIYGVPLWRFPFILLPFAFCIYTGYCLFLKLYVVQYQRKEVINDSGQSSQRNNYFKLVALIVDVSHFVLWKYIEEKVLGSHSFESYLNNPQTKHKIFHIYKNILCCECNLTKMEGEKIISEKQFQMLYKCDEKKSIANHKKYIRVKVTQTCICCYSAVKNVSVRVLDITLAKVLIKRCGKQALGLEMWMGKITEIRNEIFHLSDIQEMADDKFNRRWQQLEGSIMGIANLLQNNLPKDIQVKIKNIKRLVVISDQVLKHERLCRDYWKYKCAELERMQKKVMKASIEELCTLYPGNANGSNEMMSEEVFKKIDTLNTVVDQIFINVFGNDGLTQIFESQDTLTTEEDQTTVPVLFQLEVPKSWNPRQIMKAVEQMRISGINDTGIIIKAVSSDDLYIFAEIVKKVLRESVKLRIEISQLVTNILTRANVDTAERADVNINLQIPKSKDFNNPARVKTELSECIPLKARSIISNCIIAGNHIVYIETGIGLQICKMDGNIDQTINIRELLTETCEYRLLVIDCDTIAVSYCSSFIYIVNLSTGYVKKTIELETISFVFGIAYGDGLLYIVGHLNMNPETMVIVMNLRGERIRNFCVSFFNWSNQSIVTDSKRLFTISQYHSIDCYDLKGNLHWEFKIDETSYIEYIETYEDGQLFVVDVKKDKIGLLSSDGKSLDVIMTLKHSQHVYGIQYDNMRKLLMLYDNNVHLYQVNH